MAIFWTERTEWSHFHHISLLIFWFLWTKENDTKHREIHMVPKQIVWRVYRMIYFLHLEGLFRDSHQRWNIAFVPLFGISMTFPLTLQPIMDVWPTLSIRFYEIKIDGCFKDGLMSDGDIIKDHTRHCIRAFQYYMAYVYFGGQTQSYIGWDSTGQRTQDTSYLG